MARPSNGITWPTHKAKALVRRRRRRSRTRSTTTNTPRGRKQHHPLPRG